MPDTFKGEWHRPRDDRRHDRQRGHDLGEIRERAGFDNEPQTGCGALFLFLVLGAVAVLGLALS
jgi:hypothetical protein